MTEIQKMPGARFRALMDDHCVSTPGAFNGMVGRAVAQKGFEAVYVSGAAVSACAGVPDVGLLSLEHFCRVIREVADGSGLPLLADADTGFGEVEMVVRTVHDYHRAGAAGMHIEDQVFPKRCGHLDGKTLISTQAMAEKLSRAAGARDACSGGTFVVCARTDAAGVEGVPAAIERARAYVDAGADMIFPEGLCTEGDFETFAGAMGSLGSPPYMLANMTEFGKTPMLPLSRFEEMGYRCVIFPVSTLRIAMGAVSRFLEELRRDGDLRASLGEMQTREELYALMGYTPGVEWTYPGTPG